MKRFGRAAGSNSGFTLLEVALSSVVLAMAAATVIGIYLHAIDQTGAARDLAVATSVARNAVNEGIASAAATAAGVPVPDRSNLLVTYTEDIPEEDTALFDTLRARVADVDGADIMDLAVKRAVYVLPEEEAVDGEDDSAGEDGEGGEGGEEADGASDDDGGAPDTDEGRLHVQ